MINQIHVVEPFTAIRRIIIKLGNMPIQSNLIFMKMHMKYNLEEIVERLFK